jgi:hypothetical protein
MTKNILLAAMVIFDLFSSASGQFGQFNPLRPISSPPRPPVGPKPNYTQVIFYNDRSEPPVFLAQNQQILPYVLSERLSNGVRKYSVLEYDSNADYNNQWKHIELPVDNPLAWIRLTSGVWLPKQKAKQMQLSGLLFRLNDGRWITREEALKFGPL